MKNKMVISILLCPLLLGLGAVSVSADKVVKKKQKSVEVPI